MIELNKLKRKELWLNETIKIPDNGKDKKIEEKPKSDDKAIGYNKGKNSKIVEAEKAVSKKDQKQEKAENKKEQQIAIRIAEIENTFNFFIEHLRSL